MYRKKKNWPFLPDGKGKRRNLPIHRSLRGRAIFYKAGGFWGGRFYSEKKRRLPVLEGVVLAFPARGHAEKPRPGHPGERRRRGWLDVEDA